jgi:hypothetical protein
MDSQELCAVGVPGDQRDQTGGHERAQQQPALEAAGQADPRFARRDRRAPVTWW